MRQLPVSPTKKETLWSLVYMALEFLVLPTLLTLGNAMLPTPLSEARLNLLFFLMNYLIVGLILRKFIGKDLMGAKPALLLSSAAVGMMQYWVMNLFVGSLILFINPEFSNVNDATVAGMIRQDMLFSVLGTVVLVPPCEELLFRGVIFGSLYNRRPIAAYILSAMCFSAIHVLGYIGLFPWDVLVLCFVQYIPAGICLARAYVRSGSILAPIIIHTLVNAMGVSIMR